MDVVHPDDVDELVGAYVRAFEARMSFLLEYRLRRADGAYRWLLATGVPKYGRDGSFAGYVGCDIDITERRDAEDRMRESRAALEVSHKEIQHLAGRLIEAQDAERARVARDLHDDVSQQLAGLSIALSSLKHRMEATQVSEELKADLLALHQRTGTLARDVRHLSHDLHPTVLRHGGLMAALTSYCAELQRSHGPVLGCERDGGLGVARPGGGALPLPDRAGGAAQRHRALRRQPGGRSVAPLRRPRGDDDRGRRPAGSTSHARSTGARGWGSSASGSGSGSPRGTVTFVADGRQGTRVRVLVPVDARARVDAGSAPESEPREVSLS